MPATTQAAIRLFLARMAAQAEAQQKKQKTLGERGNRHTQGKPKKKKKKN